MLCFLVDCLLAGLGTNLPETCRGWRNILRISCASSWVLLHCCIKVHGQQNIKFIIYFKIRQDDSRISEHSLNHINLSAFSYVSLIWLGRVAANTIYILNKQSRTANEGWPSSLGVGRGANNASPWKNIVKKYSQGEMLPLETIFCLPVCYPKL